MAEPAAAAPRRRFRGVLGAAVSGALIAVLYSRLDLGGVAGALRGADPGWLAIAVAGILPITALRACRFLWTVPRGAVSGFGESLRLTVVASALNLLAPAKSGDLVKGYSLATTGGASPGVSLAVIVFERLCDLFGLIFWCVLGWIVARPPVRGLGAPFWFVLGAAGGVCGILVLSARAGEAIRALLRRLPSSRVLRRVAALAEGWPDLLQSLGARRGIIVVVSIGMWLAHLLQVWTFTVALQVPVPFLACASLSAIALMAGQMPFTVGGLGARDVALVVLMSAYLRPEQAAAMGLLMATRTLVPALLGVPFVWPYVSSMLAHARRWRAPRRHAG
jgi:uncharacterized protein (TIRG00374 family)